MAARICRILARLSALKFSRKKTWALVLGGSRLGQVNVPKTISKRRLKDAREVSEQFGINTKQVPSFVRQLMQAVKDLKKQLSSGRKSSNGSDALDVGAGKTASDNLSYFEVRGVMKEAAQVLSVPLLDVRETN